MDSSVNMGSGNKRLSLRRSIVGSIKRSLSPLSRKSDSPTVSQTSCDSAENTPDTLSFQKGLLLQTHEPSMSTSTSSRFKKSNSLSPNHHHFTESAEDSSSQKSQPSSNHVSPTTSKISKPNSLPPSNRASLQSTQDVPTLNKTLQTHAGSTASRLRKSLSTSFCTDNKHSVQALKDIPAHENNPVLPTQTTPSASLRLPKKIYFSSRTPSHRSSIQSIQELPSPEKNVSLPARASSTSGRYSTGVRLSSILNQTTTKSDQSTPPTKRSSIVSFQIPEGVHANSPQNDLLLAIKSSSNASKSNRSSWFSVSRTSSTKSRKQSHLTALQRLTSGTGRETTLSQRQYDATEAKETTLPWDPPFDRNCDLMADDGIPSDMNELFEHCVPPRLDNGFPPLFNLPIKVRRKIYSYCLPDSKDITVSLSPHFATKNCYHGYYFTSPWDVLEPVAGGLASFSLMRNDLMTYFWTEYQFHATLIPFCNSLFTPLTSVWLLNFLDRIQHLTIEIDLTRFGGNALKFARRFGYNMEKMENLLSVVIDGLMGRRGKMAELIVLCRRFSGNRRVDENDPTWKAEDVFEYFPKEAMQFCDAIINLRGTVKSVRIAGFPLDYTKTLLKSMFGQGEDLRQYVTPNRSAWPPCPQLYAGPRHAANLYAASIYPMSPELPDYRDSLNTQWQYEASMYSGERPGEDDDSLARPDTSLSVTTVGDHVKLYQDLSPPTVSLGSSSGSVEPVSDLIEIPSKNAAITQAVMAAVDRNNLKRRSKKPNPRNSRDFSPGHFYHQARAEPESDLFSQEGQQTLYSDTTNQIRQASNNKRASQKANWSDTHSSTPSSHRSVSDEKEKPLPKTPNPLSKRKSQFSERQMPDIPESPINPNRILSPTPLPAIRSGTLKPSNDRHLTRIHSHIFTSENIESSNKDPSPSTSSLVSESETVAIANDRIIARTLPRTSTSEVPNYNKSIVRTPSLTSKSEVPKDNKSIVRTPPRTSKSEVPKYDNGPSSSRSSLKPSTHDTPPVLKKTVDRSILRTPSPKARTVVATSPNTLNDINERDPAYLRSIRALRSASNSTESIIRAPAKVVLRPTSLKYPAIHTNTAPAAPQRSSTGAEQSKKKSATEQSGNSGEWSSKRMRFLDMMSRRKG
ncbi:hypothetical protein SBOR_4769 [Sclerotinia borealis F-4128]|uniref:Uncharacterized protein n=1 Tax=Sclerotinia borealis (strain F-4128) TaxID=1432307 RepID=W9CJJ3_SCLBF|nr:hypothetical protein SBOR_4769 [Sclerotinia borealis F-4128]